MIKTKYSPQKNIELIHIITSAVNCNLKEIPLLHPKLEDPPPTITGSFSNILGDSFHFMDRPKFPVHHEYKKSYFVALREA